MPYWMPGSQNDRKAMHYFCTFGAVDLSGYLPVRSWDTLALQLYESVPVVRLAVVALGYAHLEHCANESLSEVALQGYQTALRRLCAYMKEESDPRITTVLVYCIIFFTFKQIAGNFPNATFHLRNGMAILTNGINERPGILRLGYDASTNSLHSLARMFTQLETEAKVQNQENPSQLAFPRSCLGAIEPFDHSGPRWVFHNPHDFMAPWMLICHNVWRFIADNSQFRHIDLSDVPKHVIAERAKLQSYLHEWHLAYKDYASRSPLPSMEVLSSLSHTSFENNTTAILHSINTLITESHYFVVKRMLVESLDDPPGFRPWDKNPGKILRLSEKIILLKQAYKRQRAFSFRRTFSTHLGVLESFSVLAHRTSLQAVRAQAQSVICQLSLVQEGLTGLSFTYARCASPPPGFILHYELPGH